MEQLIFTYCYNRYFETGGGWGVFSYSKGMEDYLSNNEKLKRLSGTFGYEVPKNRNVWLISHMTDYEADIKKEMDSIKKYHPEKFAYQIVSDDESELSVFTFGRNLGREIVDESRALNKLVYTAAGKSSEITDYPCFYYGIENFNNLTRDVFKNSSRTENAPLLPQLNMTVGEEISRESVHRFLSEKPNSADILVFLFYSLLEECSGRRRPILICDKKENIIFWVSACTLLFPSSIAKKIFFSTYDSLGTNANTIEFPNDLQLCGVYSPTANDAPAFKATNYDKEKLKNCDDIVLFDLECGIIPQTETDLFEDVIRRFCRGDESELMNFFEHIRNNTIYSDYGKEYTMFYKSEMDIDNENLFQYYTDSIKTKVFNKVYSSIYDKSVSNMQKAIKIISVAIDSEIVEKNKIVDDIFLYTAEDLKSGTPDFSLLEEIEPLILLVNYSVKKLVKAIINQNLEKWLEYLTEKPSIPTSKLIKIMELYSPYDENELFIIRKLYVKINDAEYKQKADSMIYKWFAQCYESESPQYDISKIQIFVDISGNTELYAESTSECFMKWWSEETCKSALIQFENMPIGAKTLGSIESKVWSVQADYDRAYEILNSLMENKSRFAQNWYDKFFEKLNEAYADIQKTYVCKIILNPQYKYNLDMQNLIDSVYKRYNFSSAQELADMSVLVFGNIYLAKGQMFSLNIIDYALKRLKRQNMTKKEWKKAVSATPDYNISAEVLKDVRNQLIEHGVQLIESDKENTGLFKKLFGKSKK